MTKSNQNLNSNQSNQPNMAKIGQAITAVENFVSKEVKGAENIMSNVTAFIEKETPAVKTLLADVQAAYQAAKVAEPYVVDTVNALAILFTELSLAL